MPQGQEEQQAPSGEIQVDTGKVIRNLSGRIADMAAENAAMAAVTEQIQEGLQQTIAALKVDLEAKDIEIARLQRELSETKGEVTDGGSTEEPEARPGR